MRAVASAAAVAGLVGAVLMGAPAPGAQARGVAVCEVVTMAQPPDALGGTVTDLERVRGLGVVYGGGVLLPREDGPALLAPVLWFGLRGQPRPVGPAGMVGGIVHEVRPSGVISGESVDADGRSHAWVQRLRSGRVTIVDTGGAESFWVEHVNDRGEAAGTLRLSGTETEARAWWPRVDRPGRLLPSSSTESDAWDINDRRQVAGSIGLGDFAFQAVIWDARGRMTRLANVPGSAIDSQARLIDERGAAAGFAWWGDRSGGHLEAARWPTPDRIEPLGLLPDGGFSAALGQSERGWVVGSAEHWDPTGPDAGLGPVSHAVLWTHEPGHVRVLPSPRGIADGVTDWRAWQSFGARAVHTGLDRVGGAAESGRPDGAFQADAVVWVNASRCGERVPTTHTAFWEASPAQSADASRSVPTERPAAYAPEAVRQRIAEHR